MLLLHMQIRRYFNKLCDDIEFNRHLFLSFLCFGACRVWCLPDHWIGSFCWWYFRHFLWTLHMQCVYLYDKGILYLHLFKSLNMNWIKTILSLVYIYIVFGDLIIKIMMIEISLTVQLRHIFVLLPNQDLDSQRLMPWYHYMFNYLRWEVIVRFVIIEWVTITVSFHNLVRFVLLDL